MLLNKNFVVNSNNSFLVVNLTMKSSNAIIIRYNYSVQNPTTKPKITTDTNASCYTMQHSE